jgi:hypothetical protein
MFMVDRVSSHRGSHDNSAFDSGSVLELIVKSPNEFLACMGKEMKSIEHGGFKAESFLIKK